MGLKDCLLAASASYSKQHNGKKKLTENQTKEMAQHVRDARMSIMASKDPALVGLSADAREAKVAEIALKSYNAAKGKQVEQRIRMERIKLDLAKKLDAMHERTNGDEGTILASYFQDMQNKIDGQQHAYISKLHRMFNDFFEPNWLGTTKQDAEIDFEKAVYGQDASPEAMQKKQEWDTFVSSVIKDANDAGMDISELFYTYLPQLHLEAETKYYHIYRDKNLSRGEKEAAARKLSKLSGTAEAAEYAKAKDAWVSDKMRQLNRDTWFDDDGNVMNDADFKASLEDSFDRIVGGRDHKEAKDFDKGDFTSIKSRHNMHRSFHFKDYESYREHMDIMGGGNLYREMRKSIENLARDIVLVRETGGDPNKTKNFINNYLASKRSVGKQSNTSPFNKVIDGFSSGEQLWKYHFAANDTLPSYMHGFLTRNFIKFSNAARDITAFQKLSKAGEWVTQDIATTMAKATAMHGRSQGIAQGGRVIGTATKLLWEKLPLTEKRLTDELTRHYIMSDMLYEKGMQQLYGEGVDINNKTAILAKFENTVSGTIPLTDVLKQANKLHEARAFGRLLETNWEDLSPIQEAILKEHNFTKEEYQMMQKARQGNTALMPDHIASLDDSVIMKANPEGLDIVHSYYQGAIDNLKERLSSMNATYGKHKQSVTDYINRIDDAIVSMQEKAALRKSERESAAKTANEINKLKQIGSSGLSAGERSKLETQLQTIAKSNEAKIAKAEIAVEKAKEPIYGKSSKPNYNDSNVSDIPLADRQAGGEKSISKPALEIKADKLKAEAEIATLELDKLHAEKEWAKAAEKADADLKSAMDEFIQLRIDVNKESMFNADTNAKLNTLASKIKSMMESTFKYGVAEGANLKSNIRSVEFKYENKIKAIHEKIAEKQKNLNDFQKNVWKEVFQAQADVLSLKAELESNIVEQKTALTAESKQRIADKRKAIQEQYDAKLQRIDELYKSDLMKAENAGIRMDFTAARRERALQDHADRLKQNAGYILQNIAAIEAKRIREINKVVGSDKARLMSKYNGYLKSYADNAVTTETQSMRAIKKQITNPAAKALVNTLFQFNTFNLSFMVRQLEGARQFGRTRAFAEVIQAERAFKKAEIQKAIDAGQPLTQAEIDGLKLDKDTQMALYEKANTKNLIKYSAAAMTMYVAVQAITMQMRNYIHNQRLEPMDIGDEDEDKATLAKKFWLKSTIGALMPFGGGTIMQLLGMESARPSPSLGYLASLVQHAKDAVIVEDSYKGEKKQASAQAKLFNDLTGFSNLPYLQPFQKQIHDEIMTTINPDFPKEEARRMKAKYGEEE